MQHESKIDAARVLPALRGAGWDGTRCRTLRLLAESEKVALTKSKNAAEILSIDEEVTDPAEIARRYQQHLTGTQSHPRRIVVGEQVILAGPAADELDVSTPVESKPTGGDPVATAATSRDQVMRNRIAIVTGAAQGFGYEIARGLAAGGAQVILADLNLEGARNAASTLNSQFGRKVHWGVEVDVTREDSVREMVEAVVAEYGGFDLVVSNAGVLKAGSVKQLAVEDFEFVTRVNYEGFFLMTKHSAAILETQNRAAAAAQPNTPLQTDIIEINSKSGLIGSNKNGAYAGSKFGGIGLVQSFALELIEDNVKVNAICPGNFFDGPLWSDPERGLFVQYLRAGKVPGAKTIEDVRASYEARVPMKRGCTGADVVRAIAYVVEQPYETGQAVPVTGGQEMLR
ncbi:MAG: SDR family NAD(P)-dependent oxidoreductase [Alkalispirochaeta sp.]